MFDQTAAGIFCLFVCLSFFLSNGLFSSSRAENNTHDKHSENAMVKYVVHQHQLGRHHHYLGSGSPEEMGIIKDGIIDTIIS